MPTVAPTSRLRTTSLPARRRVATTSTERRRPGLFPPVAVPFPTMHASTHDGHLPTLSPGLTVLRRPSARSPALHRLVVANLPAGAPALWVDARNDASTYLLDGAAPRGALSGLRVARAFTAYQHHALVGRAAARATGDTALVVVPCAAALYGDDDVPEAVAGAMLDDALARLRAVAADREVPVLATTPGDGFGDGRVADAADRVLTATATDQGVRFAGDGVETTAYWRRDGWQTTIDYWVDLFGCVCDRAPAGPAPAAPAAAGG